MKKLLFLISFVTLVISKAEAQEAMSFTIRPVPGEANKAKLFVRSNQDISGFISSVIFTFTLPATLQPRPVVTIAGSGSYAYINYSSPNPPVLQQTHNGVSYHSYTFLDAPTNTATQNFTANTEVEFATVTINSQTETTSELRLANFPDGGDGALAGFYFELGGDGRTNFTSLFYGPGAVNAGSFSGYSFVPASVVLPVNFKGFYAIKQGDNAKLSWDVSGDEKNNYFQIQRSTDGRNFSNIQKVEALKNGRSDNSYETMDLNLSKLGSKEVYYQIAQFDQDGTKNMSPVRKLSVDGLGKAVVAYPNPTPANAKLVVDAPEAGKGQIILRDNLGRQVQNINAQFNKGINQFELQMSGLSNGDYKVTVQGAGLNETIKLQKIR